MTNRAINAGIDAQNGFALQRNTAIFLLLDNYFKKFKDKKYFVCLEHHDDFLFCFLNENDEVDLIEAYQSKKKSSEIWRLNPELYGILTKLLKTGKALIKDDISKSSEYNHILYFSSNQNIYLEFKPAKSDQLPNISVSIKADNKNSNFSILPDKIKEKIKENITEIDLHNELDNLSFIWIPFTTTEKEQENHLVGKIDEVFGKKIVDKRAAIDALIFLFGKIETIYNQGNIVKLLDETKRVSNSEVENAFNILTTKTKCFDYWHSKEAEIAKTLKIKPIDKEQFKLNFSSAFDLFKSIKQAEHKKIINFVEEQINNLTTFSEEENVFELFDLFKNTYSTHFNDLQLKAILFAAIFEVLHVKET